MLKIKRASGNGQAQCKGCKNKGIWNVCWCTFFYKVEGKDGVYCQACVNEMKTSGKID